MKTRIALLHGASYVGGELIRLLLAHPEVSLTTVTSRTFAGEPIERAHPHLHGFSEKRFTDPDEFDPAGVDGVLIAAEHGRSAPLMTSLGAHGFEGIVVDLSADFRLGDAKQYEQWFGSGHPAPELIPTFVYGLPEVHAPYEAGVRRIANPGCFATGISLALWPLTRHIESLHACVVALTGASGSGVLPKATTHFPTRDGNVRAYKTLTHQHLPEIDQVLEQEAVVWFVPVSGPWTRGIWGTAQMRLPEGVQVEDVERWYADAYAHRPLVRLHANVLPELRFAVHTPFCDIGWVIQDGHLVVGFAEDNLLKGAAGQAIQNMNLLLGLPETMSLLPIATAPQ